AAAPSLVDRHTFRGLLRATLSVIAERTRIFRIPTHEPTLACAPARAPRPPPIAPTRGRLLNDPGEDGILPAPAQFFPRANCAPDPSRSLDVQYMKLDLVSFTNNR